MQTGTGWIFLAGFTVAGMLMIPEIIVSIFLIKKNFEKIMVYADIFLSFCSVAMSLLSIAVLSGAKESPIFSLITFSNVISYAVRTFVFLGKYDKKLKILCLLMTGIWSKIVWFLPFFALYYLEG